MDVRKSMCTNLSSTALSLGLKLTKKYLFEEYNTLLNDEEVSVQEAAIISVMEIAQIFDVETKCSFLIPLWKRLCDETNSKLTDTLLQYFGSFVWCVKDELSAQDKQYFLTYYLTQVATSKQTQRKICLYNFPVLVFNLGDHSLLQAPKF
jgi:hypothetical protein